MSVVKHFNWKSLYPKLAFRHCSTDVAKLINILVLVFNKADSYLLLSVSAGISLFSQDLCNWKSAAWKVFVRGINHYSDRPFFGATWLKFGGRLAWFIEIRTPWADNFLAGVGDRCWLRGLLFSYSLKKFRSPLWWYCIEILDFIVDCSH